MFLVRNVPLLVSSSTSFGTGRAWCFRCYVVALVVIVVVVVVVVIVVVVIVVVVVVVVVDV